MSAIKKAQEKVSSLVVKGDATLVAAFDFSILIDIAMKFLMQYLGNCMSVNQASAETRVQDGFWYDYFVQKAAKDAVEQKYGKKERSKEARKLLATSISQIDPNERKAIVAELQEAHDDAGLLI